MKKFWPRSILILAVLCGWLAMAGMASAQEAAGSPTAAHPAGKSVLQTITDSGPLGMTIWVVLLITSITMVSYVIRNVMELRHDRLAPPLLVSSLRQVLADGNYQEAWEICAANRSYLANTLKAGLERLGRGKDVFDNALADHGLREAQVLRTRNSYLSVIGVVSPMIGLLGTVIGMMKAFTVLGSSGISSPRELASSISEVLLATASGLFIAIPAFVSYYIFRNRAQMAIVNAEDQLNLLVEDIPFEELQGIRIGQNFSAGDTGIIEDDYTRQVSMGLTTNCPVCNSPITPGQTPCPNCNSVLDWKQ